MAVVYYYYIGQHEINGQLSFVHDYNFQEYQGFSGLFIPNSNHVAQLSTKLLFKLLIREIMNMWKIPSSEGAQENIRNARP